MSQKDLILRIFNEKDENGLFTLNDNSEYLSKLHEQHYQNKKLFNFIYNNLPNKTKEDIINLIDDFFAATYDTNYESIKLYYYYGFKDGMEFKS